MRHKLLSDHYDLETLKSLVTKRKTDVRLPQKSLFNIFADHGKLVELTDNENFKLTMYELTLIGEAVGGKLGKTKEVSVNQLAVKHLLHDHELMMESVEKVGTKYAKIT